jgi:glycosyltransferase involved in cell wall biosynthesis
VNENGSIGDLVQDHKRSRNLVYLSEVQDADLSVLLKNARGLIQSSAAGGALLNMMDAAACGVPLLLSEVRALRDFAGSNALYFQAGNSKALASTVTTTLSRGPAGSMKIEPRTWFTAATELATLLLQRPV